MTNEGTGSGSADRSQVRAVTRALSILSCFTPANPLASLSEIARLSDLPVATASRILATLESSGYIVRDLNGSYGLGSRMLQVGLMALSSSVYQQAEVYLKEIARQTGETANLGVKDSEGNVLYLRQIESSHAVRAVNWVGRSVPVHGTAIGAALRGEVNEHGFAATRATLEADVTAVAAPVRGPFGEICAALSVTGPTYRIDDEKMLRFGRLVAEQAALMTQAARGAQP